MQTVLLVFLGAGLGGVLRHGVNMMGARLLPGGFPIHTLAVNVVGSLAMGLLAGWFVSRGGNEPLRLLLGVGVLGGFTTFSAFSLDAVLLWQRGDVVGLALYVGGSVVLSIGALFLGLATMR
jgi:CrcB protein